MALTPEDVVNKRFEPTRFREGYDQDEVDDFLDEVVVELRRLNQENEELRQRLAASEARINELQRSGASAPAAAPVQPAVTEAAPVAPAPAPVPAPAVFPAPVQDDPTSTNNLLQLARRLHEEHVREGAEKRDALIAEGHATAARIVGEAEAQQRARLSTLEQERTALEQKIDELRTFEREYRQKLKGHLEGLLSDLDSSAVTSGAPASVDYGSVPTPPPASFQGFGGN
ncbi:MULTISPECIES: DivIVA domain-containing protein [unclassified Cryobacterium]|uniref:DivIVA domain-containing protein n=1 Tax=unclassified Cryobacterium TaxID=2649013 RepID=UPI001444A39D|nr:MULTISPECIES: DivIVA domain-containing protein [unclassified Cryobacterium]